nr:MAG TPA: repressor domain protein [Bacteriophage sp.]
MNEIRVFKNKEFGNVRMMVIDGKPYFAGSDVATALGYQNPSRDVQRHCKNVVKGRGTDSVGRQNEMSFISEFDIYRLVMRSKLPDAGRFQDWVVEEVLPSIRKHGVYMTPETIKKVLLNPDTIIRLVTELKDEREKNVRLSAKIAKDREKVLFANAVGTADGCIQVGELAKLMCQNGCKIGRQRLFGLLFSDGWIMRGSYGRYVPKQYAVEAGYMRIQERIIHVNGEERLTQTILITPKGQQYFINRYVIHQQPVFDWSGA